jgi:hypothetical protein
VKENRAVITSVISYCGPTINNSAKITTDILPTCLDENGGGVLPALAALGVLNEMWIGRYPRMCLLTALHPYIQAVATAV